MLKKLSLATLIAMGSINFATAADLSNAIKGTELNGYLKLDFDFDKEKTSKKTTDTRSWTTDAKFVFGVPVSENTKMITKITAEKSYVTTDTTGSEESDGTLQDSMFYVNYKKDGIGANVGLVPLDFLPYASSDDFTTAYGAGADATYTMGDFTLAAGWVDQIFNVDEDEFGSDTLSNDVYTIGAIYDNEKIGSAKLWYAKVTNLLKYNAILMTKANIANGFSVNFDYAQSKLDKKDAKNHNFYNFALNAEVDAISATAGYCATNKNNGKVITSGDAELGGIPIELRSNIANEKDAKALYTQLGYDVTDKINLYAGYTNISQDKNDGDGDSNEYELGASYQVNKKFEISAYYDILDYSENSATDQQEAQVEFEYEF